MRTERYVHLKNPTYSQWLRPRLLIIPVFFVMSISLGAQSGPESFDESQREMPFIEIEGKDNICEHESVLLTVPNLEGATYVWSWRSLDLIPLPPFTPFSTYPIMNHAGEPAGRYEYAIEVKLNIGEIVTDTILVEKHAPPEAPPMDQTLFRVCEGDDLLIELTETFEQDTLEFTIVDTLGFTFIVDTFIGDTFFVDWQNVQLDQAGYYELYVFDEWLCFSDPNPFFLDVLTLQNVPDANAGDDLQLCMGEQLNLAASDPFGLVGEWTQPTAQGSSGVSIQQTDGPFSPVSGITEPGEYEFYWTQSVKPCGIEKNDTVVIEYFEIPNENAIVDDDSLLNCEGVLVLGATYPSVGTGSWLTVQGGDFSDPAEAVTDFSIDSDEIVEVIWSLSNGGCENYTQDTITIYPTDDFGVSDDNYILDQDADQINTVPLANDELSINDSYIFSIIEGPSGGELQVLPDNQVVYFPTQEYTSYADSYMYEICSITCPESCEIATVNLDVIRPDHPCWMPNFISPNGDGDNDILTTPCMVDYPESTLTVYNRWGDVVYQEQNYSNDWDGTYDGKELPAGTYFYTLSLAPSSERVFEGYLTLIR
ncbi:MAG: T9SS type B sorting domain-containing protein [Saprospiraceae bacterium]|nr:T9SS type B sorting domain-containing protein [Saprospiraceae bacterium]